MTRPATTTPRPRRSTAATMFPRRAPSAIRMPISRVRDRTDRARTAKPPTAASTTAKPLSRLKTAAPSRQDRVRSSTRSASSRTRMNGRSGSVPRSAAATGPTAARTGPRERTSSVRGVSSPTYDDAWLAGTKTSSCPPVTVAGRRFSLTPTTSTHGRPARTTHRPSGSAAPHSSPASRSFSTRTGRPPASSATNPRPRRIRVPTVRKYPGDTASKSGTSRGAWPLAARTGYAMARLPEPSSGARPTLAEATCGTRSRRCRNSSKTLRTCSGP